MHELVFFHPIPKPESDFDIWDGFANFTLETLNFNLTGNITEKNATLNDSGEVNNWWALVALILVLCTAAGNVLVCLAIYLERRLQNVTNYFLMSLAITDLLVAILVMPLGILTLVRGYFPLPAVYCLTWICLDVLLCTASIMHLCTISVDRYLSLRYPMRFGRNKTRKRVTIKIVFVWILSTAMSLPLSLMYSKNEESVLIGGVCQVPDPLYKAIGSIISFYIPLGVMLLTYALTVQLLARQRKGLGAGWAAGWLGAPPIGIYK
ncbi:5-hydroxytryptamine receptor 2C-like [Ostrinia furnacalis]|uniref:5-hydroxytryptamine receptor 2C-like n=1 Tax=Ostrinia furnacalis TaxID=93504 RepID=UPI0010387827|nr:5-hydroxytryptamine receptor 2C-like [Ostrinia furnacalis]